MAPSRSTVCANGCLTEPMGTADVCRPSGGTTGSGALGCPDVGDFCGSDGVQNGDANTLYYCPGQGLPPNSSTPCPTTCVTEPAGTSDLCAGPSSTSAAASTTSGATSSSGSTGGSGLACPGSGDYCGSDGVTGGATNTLYHCAERGQAPFSSDSCASGCAVMPPGTNDVCSSSGVTSTTGSTTGGAPLCPGAGAYCGSDGVSNGSPNTLYTCPSAGGAPTSSLYCNAGCIVAPAGTADSCNNPLASGSTTGGSGVSCPGAGPYCGSDGVQGGVANTLYQCPAAGAPPTTSLACPSTCTVEPAGTPDRCASSGPVCPGQGDYCGSDGVQGGDANTLYHCPGAGLAPGASSACSTGCSVQAAGTPDVCAGTSPTCPGSGAYCGSDGVQGGDANTLYQCPSAGAAPSSSAACASGCTVEPAGTPDLCAGSALGCPGAGDYCGSDGVQGGVANTLYRCPGAGSAPSGATPCASSCMVEPSGTNDVCSLQCPAAGDFCGADGVVGGDANTLYHCGAAGAAPASADACAAGCTVEASGTSDYCSGSCSSDAVGALAFEANIINANQGGSCSGVPPLCYSEYCLGLVNDAFTSAGESIPELQVYSAADSLLAFENAGNFHAWAGSCPCGAILFWAPNSCNSSDGHVVICNGDGTVSSSGWSNYAGSTRATVDWLMSEECGAEPAGYALP